MKKMWMTQLVFGCRSGRVGRHNVDGRREGKGGKPSQLWSNLGLVIQDTGHRGGGFRWLRRHSADPLEKGSSKIIILWAKLKSPCRAEQGCCAREFLMKSHQSGFHVF